MDSVKNNLVCWLYKHARQDMLCPGRLMRQCQFLPPLQEPLDFIRAYDTGLVFWAWTNTVGKEQLVMAM